MFRLSFGHLPAFRNVQERKVKFNGMANIELLSENAHRTTHVAYTALPNTFIYWNQRTIYSVAINQRHVKEKSEQNKTMQ